MSTKNQKADDKADEQDDVPAAVVQKDVARAVSDSKPDAVATGPLPPQPGDPDYKRPELWGRGKAESPEHAESRLGQPNKAPATEA